MWRRSGAKMTALKTLLLIALAAAAPSAVRAASSPPASGFGNLWTGWQGANREAMRAESEGLQRMRRDVASAGAQRLHQLRSHGRALGERVGEIVRAGDCDDGERVARIAGDFALVEAVRGHCGAGAVDRPPGR
jgi:hypothetical protein